MTSLGWWQTTKYLLWCQLINVLSLRFPYVRNYWRHDGYFSHFFVATLSFFSSFLNRDVRLLSPGHGLLLSFSALATCRLDDNLLLDRKPFAWYIGSVF